MMKSILKVLTLIFLAFQLQAQVPTCSLNPTFIASNKVGIWPDSATNFIQGTVGTPYIQNITVKVPKDTVNSSILFCFNRFELSNPTGKVNYGLPPGLNFGVSTATLNNGTVNGAPAFRFPGNANNCASIYGTPTTAGTYTLYLKVDAYATPSFGPPCPNNPNITGGTNVSSQQLTYYIIKINAATGIKESIRSNFGLQNIPNPFTSNTTIKFSLDESGPIKLSVFNMLGKEVIEITKNADQGTNEIQLNCKDLSSGLYFYTLKFKGNSETKRMILDQN